MKDLAKRLQKLGTETAYIVSAEAKAYADAGNKVYPFHIGDLNFATAPNIIQAAKKAIDDGKTGYCPAAGIQDLREAIAEDINKSHGTNYTYENVSIQPGGKPVIPKLIMTVTEPGDEVLYPSPGYPIYESQVNFQECVKKPYIYHETENGFAFDMDYFKSLISPKTKLFIYNNYQNPMGACSTDEEMAELAKLAVENDWYVLSDEAYFDVVYEGDKKSIVSLPGMQERTVILYTFSKKFAMTGWRLGAAIGPKNLIDPISKINSNDEACTNHFVQYAGVEALRGDQSYSKKIVDTLKERLEVIYDILNDCPGITVFKPKATFYLFINVTEVMEKLNMTEMEVFRKHMLKKTGVSFCTREHFGDFLPQETQKYIRLAYSGIDIPEIKEGLSIFKKYISDLF